MKEAALRTPETAYEFAKASGRRIPEAEDMILTDLSIAIKYARDVIGGRWPQLEKLVKTSPDWSMVYATDVVDGR